MTTNPIGIIANAIRAAEFTAASTAATPADTVLFPTQVAKVAAAALIDDVWTCKPATTTPPTPPRASRSPSGSRR